MRSAVEDVIVRMRRPLGEKLPNLLALIWYPIITFFVFVILVLLELNGTSGGVFWNALGNTAPDPNLILGTPRPIRSDEYLVQTPWIISQSVSGFPALNMRVPGGIDMTVLQEIPSWDWSTAFRPHMWGYLFLGLNMGAAWYWWFPALALVNSAYVFGISFIPKRPFVVAMIATAVFFTPMIQWWYTPTTLGAIAWPLLAMTAVVWAMKSEKSKYTVFWATLTSYSAITLVMGLYIPFIVPGLILFAGFTAGSIVNVYIDKRSLQAVLHRFLPLILGGVFAVAVVAIYLATRWKTVETITSTLYPGQRSANTGAIFVEDKYLGGIFGAPWSEALRGNYTISLLGGNASEASGSLLLFVFLLIPIVWVNAKRLSKKENIDWQATFVLVSIALILAYMFIPGWNELANAIQMGHSSPSRYRIAFVLANPLFLFIFLSYIASGKLHIPKWVIGLTTLSAICVPVAYSYVIMRKNPEIFVAAPTALFVIALVAISVLLFFFEKAWIYAACLFLVASMLTASDVNPLYKGLFNFNSTNIGSAIQKINDLDSGNWVGIGRGASMVSLADAGVVTYTAVQTYPSEKMWNDIDPNYSYEEVWNRLAHVYWVLGEGEPKPMNPQADVIEVNFDACSSFSQEHVKYVLIDGPIESRSCLKPIESVSEASAVFTIYRVVKA